MERARKLEIIRGHPLALSEYPELHDDTEAVLIALDACPRYLSYRLYNYASLRVRKEGVILLSLLSKDGNSLGNIPEELRLKVFVLAAVNNYGTALEFASDELRADKEVVLAAANNDGTAIQYANYELRRDKEVVLAAVNNFGGAIVFATYELRGDKEVVLVAVNNYGESLRDASAEMRGDREVVLAAVNNDGMAFQYASDELKADKDVVLAAVNNNGMAFQYASQELQGDKDVIRISLRRPYTEGQYNNINMPPVVGDYVTLKTEEPQSNPVVHTVVAIVPPDKVRINNILRDPSPIKSFNFIPRELVFNDIGLGLRLRDRTFTIRGGKRKKHTKRFKKKYSMRKRHRTTR